MNRKSRFRIFIIASALVAGRAFSFRGGIRLHSCARPPHFLNMRSCDYASTSREIGNHTPNGLGRFYFSTRYSQEFSQGRSSPVNLFNPVSTFFFLFQKYHGVLMGVLEYMHVQLYVHICRRIYYSRRDGAFFLKIKPIKLKVVCTSTL